MHCILKPLLSALNPKSLRLADFLVLATGLWIGALVRVLASRFPASEPLGDIAHWDITRCDSTCCGPCRQPFGILEFIPLIGPTVLKRRCKYHCDKRIQGYLSVEIATAVALLVLYKRYGLSLSGLLHMMTAAHLCVLAGTDIMYRLLPNRLLLSALGFSFLTRMSGLVEHYIWKNQVWQMRVGHIWAMRGMWDMWDMWGMSDLRDSLLDGFWGASLGFGLLLAVALVKPGAMGGGDVKMAGVVGFYLGFPAIVFGLAVGFVLAAFYTVPMLLLGRLKTTDTIPLGVFLSFGTIWTVAVHPV
ncbi:MAG TPA: prepilin peptidase [Firmicutes bacterium]|nr:prepilin peptidase [Bacillota bacterium]